VPDTKQPGVQNPDAQSESALQAVPSAWKAWLQPPVPQVSSVQGLLSSHVAGLPVQAPPLQVSPVVQGLESSQVEVLGAWAQPSAPQLSSVQGLASSQPFGHGVPPASGVPASVTLPASGRVPASGGEMSHVQGPNETPEASHTW
jgi:hypothetical protein